MVPDSLQLCRQACQASLSARGFWSDGQHWLPHPSRALYSLLPQPPAPLGTWRCQNPCDPSRCPSSTPGPHGANPSPPGQPQEQTPVDGPYAEVDIKPPLKPRGSVAKEEDPKASRHLHQLQIKSTRSARQPLSLWNILKVIENAHKGKCTRSESCGPWRQEHRGGAQIRIRAAPSAGPEISAGLEGFLGRGGGLRLSARERMLTALTQGKHLLFLCFDLFCRFFWIFFFFF